MMSKKIIVTCLDTQKKVSVSIDEKSFHIVSTTPPKSQENWNAYTEIQHNIEDSCRAEDVTFWEVEVEDQWWSSEL